MFGKSHESSSFAFSLYKKLPCAHAKPPAGHSLIAHHSQPARTRSRLTLLSTSMTALLGLSVCVLSAVSAQASIYTGMGTFTLDSGSPTRADTASGTYITPKGHTGRFTITRNSSTGYEGSPS